MPYAAAGFSILKISTEINVDEECLKRYEGMYHKEDDENEGLIITYRDGILTSQPFGRINWVPVKLYPYSNTDFFMKAKEKHYHFLLDDNKTVKVITQEKNRESHYRKNHA